MPTPSRELAKISRKTPKTCFCIYEDAAKAFGAWREGEIALKDDQCRSTVTGDHVKCGLFMCEIARQEKHQVASNKAVKRRDVGHVNRREAKKKEEEEKLSNYFCHLENPGDHIQHYCQTRQKPPCSLLGDDFIKLDNGEVCVVGMSKIQVLLDPIEHNAATSCGVNDRLHPSHALNNHPPLTAVQRKGSDVAGVYYAKPFYPHLSGTLVTALTPTHPSSFGDDRLLPDISSQQNGSAIVRKDSATGDWVPDNAVYQERSSNEQFYHSMGYYYQYNISLPKPIVNFRTAKRHSSTIRERIDIKNLRRKRDGKPCTVIKYKPETAEERKQVTTNCYKEGPYLFSEESSLVQRNLAGRLRSGRIKSSSVETDQEKLKDLMVTHSYASTSKLEQSAFNPQQQLRFQSKSAYGKRGRYYLPERHDTVNSIPSKSSSLSQLPELKITTRGLTCTAPATPDLGEVSENTDNKKSLNEASKSDSMIESEHHTESTVKETPSKVQTADPVHPLVAKIKNSEYLHGYNKQRSEDHAQLPRPFKPLTKVKQSPFQSPMKVGSRKLRRKKSRNDHFEEARCVLRSRERRAQMNKNIVRKIQAIPQDGVRYRVKVCLKGSKVPLADPLTKSSNMDNDECIPEELYAE